MSSPLEAEIRNRIATAGPMSVAEYMALCLTHPVHGYYMTRDPLGQGGDFTTAPEISQMFGELIGAWAATVWHMLGEPSAINLVELGPGRGTMMADALRAAKVLPAFERAISVHLVETSHALRERQRATLVASGADITWHDSLQGVPPDPAIYLANEFFDTLPVNQAIRQPDGWHERTVELGEDETLRFGVGRALSGEIASALRDAPLGAIFEWRQQTIAIDLATRVARGGAALIVDYGHTRRAVGETFQAVRGHAYHDPLIAPGTADLTAHVDFEALALAAANNGASVHGPVEQGVFLNRLGIAHRAEMLKANAGAAQVQDIEAARDRLTAMTPAGMGKMFKVLGLASAKVDVLPGFDG
jgi:NADH dehydrogenase [ubiquinone] 1 alpha subcomplex assembly factor 7